MWKSSVELHLRPQV